MKIEYGVWHEIGCRGVQEDRHIVLADTKNEWIVCAILDGHGGSEVVDYVAQNLGAILFKYLGECEDAERRLIRKRIRTCFRRFDQEMYLAGLNGGCTFSGIVHNTKRNRTFLVNLGDSKTFIKTRTHSTITVDHKPSAPKEIARISKAGGQSVVKSGRVLGIAMSRAFGDFRAKRRICSLSYTSCHGFISSAPSVREFTSAGSDMVALLASDGFWDCISSEHCTAVLEDLLLETSERKSHEKVVLQLSPAMEELACNLALAAIGASSQDNVSVLVVRFMLTSSTQV